MSQHGSVGQRPPRCLIRLPQRGRGTAVLPHRTGFCPASPNATRDMILACIDPATEGDGHIRRAQPILRSSSGARRYGPAAIWPSRTWSPSDMRRALGVSRTRLYQLFEHSGGVLPLHPEGAGCRPPMWRWATCRYATDHRHSGSRSGFTSGRQFQSVLQQGIRLQPARSPQCHPCRTAGPSPRSSPRRRKAPPSTAWLKTLGS